MACPQYRSPNSIWIKSICDIDLLPNPPKRPSIFQPSSLQSLLEFNRSTPPLTLSLPVLFLQSPASASAIKPDRISVNYSTADSRSRVQLDIQLRWLFKGEPSRTGNKMPRMPSYYHLSLDWPQRNFSWQGRLSKTIVLMLESWNGNPGTIIVCVCALTALMAHLSTPTHTVLLPSGSSSLRSSPCSNMWPKLPVPSVDPSCYLGCSLWDWNRISLFLVGTHLFS